MFFYNTDDTVQTVMIDTEQQLKSCDVCKLLAMKNGHEQDPNWSIFEHWIDIELERSIEDHEYVLPIYDQMEHNAQAVSKRFVFRKDPEKYELFEKMKSIFPLEMMFLNNIPEFLFPRIEERLYTFPEVFRSPLRNRISLETMLNECILPPMFGQVWVREQSTLLWSRAYLVIFDRKLYLAYKRNVMISFLNSCKGSAIEHPVRESEYQLSLLSEDSNDQNQLILFARLSDCFAYKAQNARRDLQAPTEYAVCLKTDDKNELETFGDVSSVLRCVACDDEKSRKSWMAGMRLSKYGKQLRENYKAYKNRQQQPPTNNENSYGRNVELARRLAANDRSRVAMDFTGNVGRIVEDPVEAQEIAESDASSQPIKLRPNPVVLPPGVQNTRHTSQPWFHNKLNRSQATALLSKYSSEDGAFLVRESRSNPGIYVLTMRCNGKIIHSQIQSIYDEAKDVAYFSLDGGTTKFFDLVQLIEFYQLNTSCMPIKLTHYLGKCRRYLSSSSNGSPTTADVYFMCSSYGPTDPETGKVGRRSTR